jgi:hypothetical protein
MEVSPTNKPAAKPEDLGQLVTPGRPAGRNLGDVCPADIPVPVDVWRYVLDEEGKRTGYVQREKYRPLRDIRRDLVAYLKGAGVEYENLDYFELASSASFDPAKYETWPDRNHCRLACYAVTGGNEGHYLHVELLTGEERILLFTGKTFEGMAHAWKVAMACADALGA